MIELKLFEIEWKVMKIFDIFNICYEQPLREKWFKVGYEGETSLAKILVVDDAKFMRVTLTNMLKKANHVVIGEAENGREAVELYRKLKPEIVTMDITMPEMTGLDAVKEIKKEFPDAKIVMCSSMGQQKMVMDAIEAGAKDYIVKPFNENRVNEAIDKVLG